jgi:hypothetical protein
MTTLKYKALLSAVWITLGLLLIIVTFFGLFGIGPLAISIDGVFFGALGFIFITMGIVYLFYRSPNDFEVAIDPEYKSSSQEEQGIPSHNIPPSETIYDELGGMEGRVVRRGKF